MPRTLSQIVSAARSRLERAGADAVDADVLIAHALGRGRAWLIAHGEYEPAEPERERIERLLGRRAAGEPVAYVTGRREFWSLEFEVSPAVLIPRPETELLVERALALLPPDSPASILDLGTGSGAVAVAIATERPHCDVVAVDESREALAVTRRNADRLAPGRVRLVASDWFSALGDTRFDLIVSNPPYVEERDPCLAEPAMAREPRRALAAGQDGLDAIRRIAAGTVQHLAPGGTLLIEHGAMQAESVAGILAARGLEVVACHRDLAGNDRVTEARPAGA